MQVLQIFSNPESQNHVIIWISKAQTRTEAGSFILNVTRKEKFRTWTGEGREYMWVCLRGPRASLIRLRITWEKKCCALRCTVILNVLTGHMAEKIVERRRVLRASLKSQNSTVYSLKDPIHSSSTTLVHSYKTQ